MSCSKLYWIHALTPLHAGSGQGAGFIDLPVMREKATGWPVVPGSTIKGVLRDHFEANRPAAGLTPMEHDRLVKIAFGPKPSPQPSDGGTAAPEAAGAVVVTDARLLLLPVRSFYGTFAWVTSPLALRRLTRDIAAAGLSDTPPDIPDSADRAFVTSESRLISIQNPSRPRMLLEDTDLDIETDRNKANKWAEFLANRLYPDPASDSGSWRKLFCERFAVVPDDLFDFLCEHATEVQPRIRIGDSGVAAAKALWYEEYLPAESVLYGIAWCDRIYSRETESAGPERPITPERVLEFVTGQSLNLQIGGKSTIGKGRIRLLFSQPSPSAGAAQGGERR